MSAVASTCVQFVPCVPCSNVDSAHPFLVTTRKSTIQNACVTDCVQIIQSGDVLRYSGVCVRACAREIAFERVVCVM